MTIYIETERLLLRGLRPRDVDFLIAMLSEPRVMKWLFSGVPMDHDSAKSFLESEFTFGKKPIGLGSLFERNPERLIGFAGIIPCRYLDREDFEFGFALREDSWGKGYAKEIGRAQIEYSFNNLKADRLLALAHPQNLASLKVLETIGMRFLKEISTDKRGPRCVYLTEKYEHQSSI